MKSSIILGTDDDLTRDGYGPLLEIVQIADQIGTDIVTVPEHLAMSSNQDEFIRRYGDSPPVDLTTRFTEPMVFMGAVAALTKRITLGTSVIVTPIRPALLMAKQMAVLDYLSGGRTSFGLGAGWQKEEFDAVNMPYKGRHRHLFEQIEAMRALWSEAPASYHGEFINFDGLHCQPFPAQGRDIPLQLGIQANDKNIARMADLGAGWVPMAEAGKIPNMIEPINKLRAAYQERGRDIAELEVATFIEFFFDDDGRPDLEKSLELVPQYKEIGVTTLIIAPSAYAPTLKEYPAVLERIERALKG
ncbi:MAG: TIGR03619 family F420-dependent LLM class oxidoreductase [Novosphingobium sp.]|nr:TIGR03619 family F420-dependent LLM class oxidoreductase [Novosphingobium sp.]